MCLCVYPQLWFDGIMRGDDVYPPIDQQLGWYPTEVGNSTIPSGNLLHERRLLFAYMESSIRAYPGLSKTSYLACKTR